MGNGVCGQSITAPLCYAFFLTLFPAPAWVLFMGCRSSWTAPVWALCLCCSSFGIRLLQHEVLYELQSGFLSSVGCKGSTSITMVFPKTEGESPPLLLLLSQGSQDCFSHIFPHPSQPDSILPFLKHIVSEAPPPWLPRAQPRTVVRPLD